MKSILILISLCALGLSGCNRSAAETRHEHAPAATYKEGHGIKLSAGGAKFAQLKTADVGIRDIADAKAVPAIPAEALLRTVKGDFVFVVNGEWLLRTSVKVGKNDAGWFEVKEGLYEGDKIVVNGARDLWLAEIHAVNGGVGCAHGH